VAVLRSPDDQRDLLRRVKTIAVVGLSADPDRDSHGVARYLQDHGYRVIGVNPKYEEVLGERCYPSLDGVPEDERSRVDLVDVFRKPEEAAETARAAARLGFKAIWFQLGVATPEAVKAAERAGMDVVAESCIKVAHRILKP